MHLGGSFLDVFYHDRDRHRVVRVTAAVTVTLSCIVHLLHPAHQIQAHTKADIAELLLRVTGPAGGRGIAI